MKKSKNLLFEKTYNYQKNLSFFKFFVFKKCEKKNVVKDMINMNCIEEIIRKILNTMSCVTFDPTIPVKGYLYTYININMSIILMVNDLITLTVELNYLFFITKVNFDNVYQKSNIG